jgi:hypothetical protein
MIGFEIGRLYRSNGRYGYIQTNLLFRCTAHADYWYCFSLEPGQTDRLISDFWVGERVDHLVAA